MDALGNLLSIKLPSPERPGYSHDTRDVIAQCKIVVYDWVSNVLTIPGGPNAILAQAKPLDVSSRVINCTFTKTISKPSGNFSFTLSNSPQRGTGDWKDIIKRGSWCVIYMSQDGDLVMPSDPGSPIFSTQNSPKIRCIGFIDRVAVRGEVNDRGAFDAVYEVSGRDFGVVYEDTDLWHNIFAMDKIMLESFGAGGLNFLGNIPIDNVISFLHRLIYNPKAVPGASPRDNSLLSIGQQWLMPSQLLKDVGIRSGLEPFWGELDVLDISPTKATMPVASAASFVHGGAWDALKRNSVPQFHELFTETTDAGLPKLVFRPMPFAINKLKYPTVAPTIKHYMDVTAVTVEPIDVISFNLGEDNYQRYNSFFTKVSSGLINVANDITGIEAFGFPRHVKDSIKRYGFRAMHLSIDSLVKNAEKTEGASDIRLLGEFNELSYDFFNNLVFSETGDIVMVGNNKIKVGKCVRFQEGTPYIGGKRYYIEGYTDSFLVDEKGATSWTQTVMVTRGFEESDLLKGGGFGDRSVSYEEQGEHTPSGPNFVDMGKLFKK